MAYRSAILSLKQPSGNNLYYLSWAGAARRRCKVVIVMPETMSGAPQDYPSLWMFSLTSYMNGLLPLQKKSLKNEMAGCHCSLTIRLIQRFTNEQQEQKLSLLRNWPMLVGGVGTGGIIFGVLMLLKAIQCPNLCGWSRRICYPFWWETRSSQNPRTLGWIHSRNLGYKGAYDGIVRVTSDQALELDATLVVKKVS